MEEVLAEEFACYAAGEGGQDCHAGGDAAADVAVGEAVEGVGDADLVGDDLDEVLDDSLDDPLGFFFCFAVVGDLGDRLLLCFFFGLSRCRRLDRLDRLGWLGRVSWAAFGLDDQTVGSLNVTGLPVEYE
ncbi:hypothetical protein [Kribbella sp. NBC_00382]|uniref:hypothetical protein n=1 Tax=Kribbella sp. NBC_00382 TaxID=2975967 RepID=UPI003FA5B39C